MNSIVFKRRHGTRRWFASLSMAPCAPRQGNPFDTFRSSHNRCSAQLGKRCAARGGISFHTPQENSGAQELHDCRLYLLLRVPFLLYLVSRASWGDALHWNGRRPPFLFHPPRHAYHFGRGDRSTRADYALLRASSAVRPAQEDCPLDPPYLALRFHHRRDGLLDSLPHLHNKIGTTGEE